MYTIIFGLSESFKITLFKALILEIIEVKVRENRKKKYFYVALPSIILTIRYLNKIILEDLNKILQINELNTFYSVIAIYILTSTSCMRLTIGIMVQ